MLNVDEDNEKMWLYLYSKFNRPRSCTRQIPIGKVSLPVGKCVHIEVFYQYSTTDKGRISVWQDGVLLYDVKNVRTAVGKRIVWGIGNYTDDIEPDTVIIYADDAAISTKRIGIGESDKDNLLPKQFIRYP